MTATSRRPVRMKLLSRSALHRSRVRLLLVPTDDAFASGASDTRDSSAALRRTHWIDTAVAPVEATSLTAAVIGIIAVTALSALLLIAYEYRSRVIRRPGVFRCRIRRL